MDIDSNEGASEHDAIRKSGNGVDAIIARLLAVSYAIRTLIRMKPKAWYPLLLIRLSDGCYMPVTT